MIAGMVIFQAKKKMMLSQQLPYKIAMLEDSKDSPAVLKASTISSTEGHLSVSVNAFISPKSAYFGLVGLFVCLFLRVLVCQLQSLNSWGK